MHCTSNLLVCTLVALSIAAAPAHAEAVATEAPGDAADIADAAGPEALSDAAVAAFQAREYDRAIELFQRAYALDAQPNYMFNIGRVYEEKGELDKAVENYQAFVRQPGVEIEARENATARIKILRQTIAQLRDDTEPDRPPAATGEITPPGERSPAERAADERKRKLRIAGYSLLGVGGGVLVIGAVFGGLAIGKSNDAQDAPFIDERLSLRQEARSRAVVGDALLISGGVVAVAGLVMVLVTLRGRGVRGRTEQASSHRRTVRRGLALAPMGGRDGHGRTTGIRAGLSLAGSF